MEKQSFLFRLSGGMKGAINQKQPQKYVGQRDNAPTKKTAVDVEQCALDIFQTNDGLTIRAFVAGVRPEDLDISIANGTLIIRGSRAETEQIAPQDFYYRECYFGPFSRSVILPENSCGDTVSAKLKNGILTIRVSKINKSENSVSVR